MTCNSKLNEIIEWLWCQAHLGVREDAASSCTGSLWQQESVTSLARKGGSVVFVYIHVHERD